MPVSLDIQQLNIAKVDLIDPKSYYGGYKAPRLLVAGRFIRALSDRSGEHEISSFSFTMADYDRLMRIKAISDAGRYYYNRTVIARMIPDYQRRLLMPARTIGIGLVREVISQPKLEWEIRCEEYIAQFFGLNRDDRQVPKRLLTRTDFPDLPSDLINKAVPIIYGDLTNRASVTPPPQLALIWNPDGGFYNPNIEKTGLGAPHMGWGTVSPASACGPPASVSVNVTGGGFINPGDSPDDGYNVAVTAVDAAMVESDPNYFNWHEPAYPHQVQIGTFGSKINVAWSPVPGAIGYRVYLGYYYKDESMQRIQTTLTSCSFDRVPRYGETPKEENIATGAELIEFSESWVYVVSALMPDGETYLSQEAYGKSQGYRRPLRLTWSAVPGAISYYVYRRKAQNKGVLGAEETSNWDRRWTIANTQTYFDDDLLDTSVEMVDGAGVINGQVPLIYVGKETSVVDGSHWHRFLVCGHACKELSLPFVDNEAITAVSLKVHLLVPGHPGYTDFFPGPPYRDINGRRYTIVYGRGETASAAARGEKKATINVKGIETAGNGAGALIEEIHAQYLHFMINFGLGDYQGGPWETKAPLWPDVDPPLEALDRSTFETCRGISHGRMGGGYRGAGMIGLNGSQETMREVIKRWNLSGDCYSGQNARSQFGIWMINDTVAVVQPRYIFTQTHDIIGGTFKVSPSTEDWENHIPYNYRRHYAREEWLSTASESDPESIRLHNEKKTGDNIELWYIQDGSVARDIMSRRLARTSEPPWYIEFDAVLPALNRELGDFVAVVHNETISEDPTEAQILFIQRLEFDADALTVSVKGLSMGHIHGGIGGGGSFILGDEETMADYWINADAEDRAYGYLCEEETGRFLDNADGKVLR